MIWELMKAQRTGVYPDLRTKYIADAFKNTSSTITEMSGELPLAFATTGLPLTNYKAYGNAVQAATPSPDNPVEVQAVGDKTANLFDFNSATFTRLGSAGTIEVLDNAVRYTLVEGNQNYGFRLLNNAKLAAGSYIISCDVIDERTDKVSNSGLRVAINGTWSSTGITRFTVTETDEVQIAFYAGMPNNGGGYVEISNIMLNEGETALPYERYGYKIPFTTAAEDGSESITTTVYLDKPLYSDDILSYSEQKVTRGWGVKVFDGTENIIRDDTMLANCFAWGCPRKKTGAILIYSSHFISTSDLPAASERGGKVFASRINSNIGFGCIGLEDIIGSTVDEFKAFLAAQYANGTPVTVYYPLSKPESESVELPKLPTLDGVTVIDTATEIKPSKMDIKYTALNLLMFSRRDN